MIMILWEGTEEIYGGFSPGKKKKQNKTKQMHLPSQLLCSVDPWEYANDSKSGIYFPRYSMLWPLGFFSLLRMEKTGPRIHH